MATETSFTQNDSVNRIIPPLSFQERDDRIELLLSRMSLSNPATEGSLASREISYAETVSSLFSSDRLLARALEHEVLGQMDHENERLCFTSVRNEMDYMESAEKLRNASCTLLVKGQEVATYKPYGFLFDAKSSEILHVAPSDSYSCTDTDGTLIARGESLSLQELADFVKKTPVGERDSMNEVNAHFATRDLKGLFVCHSENKITLLEILAIKGMIKKQYGIDLPVYIYNPLTGQLTQFTPNKDELARELIAIKNKERSKGLSMARALAPYLDIQMDERGRILRK